MPRYEIRSLDVWGNAAEGYEVNNELRDGTVLVPPQASDEEIIKALIRNGSLKNGALRALNDDALHVDDNFDFIEITENDTEWAAISDDGEGARYLDAHDREQAEEQLEEGERAEQVVGHRPLYNMHIIEGREEAVPFFRKRVEVGTKTQRNPEPTYAVLELRIDPEKLKTVDCYVDGDFFSEVDFPKALVNGHELGISRTGQTVEGDEKLAQEAQVALDAFFELGAQADPRFATTTTEAWLVDTKTNGNRMYRIDFDVGGTAHIELDGHGRIVLGHSMSALGLQEATDALKAIGVRVLPVLDQAAVTRAIEAAMALINDGATREDAIAAVSQHLAKDELDAVWRGVEEIEG